MTLTTTRPARPPGARPGTGTETTRGDPAPARWDRVRFSGPEEADTDDDGKRPAQPAPTDKRPAQPAPTRPAPSAEPPEPTHWAATVVRATVEVLKGQRPAAQLIRWVEPELWAALDRRARLAVQVEGRPHRPSPVRVRAVHGCSLSSAVWECSVVVDDGGRMRAAALRLELLRGRWCATALSIG